jgi:hypothetical protein
MPELTQYIATLAAGIWTGSAIYIGFAEHPSALKVGLNFATEYFRHMSKRTAPFMMVMSATSGIAAMYVWWNTGSSAWLAGGILQLGMFPLTAALIVPTNIKLIRIDPVAEPDLTAALHKRWGQMHWLRTVIGSVSFPLFLWLLSGSSL